jgi:hypothetical protein
MTADQIQNFIIILAPFVSVFTGGVLALYFMWRP